MVWLSTLFFKSDGDIVNASGHLSVCLSRYLLLNHWAEFYPTCYITSPHGMGVREQHYFSVHPSVCASFVRLSITLSAPPKPLVGIEPNLLHHFPSCSECARATLFFSASVRSSSVHLSVMLSPPKPLGGIQPNLLHHFPSW